VVSIVTFLAISLITIGVVIDVKNANIYVNVILAKKLSIATNPRPIVTGSIFILVFFWFF